MDISKRKEAEEVLSSITRKLIEAQEQERERIARDLHDDVGQRLALLAVRLDQLRNNPTTPPETVNQVRELQKQTTDLATDVHNMSHTLHSSKLQLLGLVPALMGLCGDFGKHQRLEIDFKAHDLPNLIPSEISLCLFRVLQEALQNAAKHSGVKHIVAQLRGTADEIQLMVSDRGRGFDLNTTRSRGLGLTSMQERVRVLNGTIRIQTKPMRGTTIRVRVPVRLTSDSRAAG